MTTVPLSKGDPTATRAAAAGSFGMSKGGDRIDRYQNTAGEDGSQAVPGAVVAEVRAARSHLMDAQFRLDDHGYYCRLLDGLNDGTATLLAEWQGRRRPGIAEELPAYIVAGAVEWRRSQKRGY